jgi:ankyrin repeat protein
MAVRWPSKYTSAKHTPEHYWKQMEDDDFERTKLHFAAGNGDLAQVRQLVESGHDIKQFDEIGYTPLHHAAKGEFFALTNYLLSIGADVNAHDEEHIGETPLGAVAASCSYDMAKLLVDAGANPTITGWMGLTALYHAKERKKPEGQQVYSLLLDIARRTFNYQL